MSMRLILLGSPGAGKGTQAQYIAQRYAIAQISTGDMLRQASQTPQGVAVKQAMDAGELIPDDVIIELVKQRLTQSDCDKGFLLDGFPRTLAQAEALRQQSIAIDYVITICVDDDTVVQRLTGRRVHPGSGRSYHVLYNSPKQAGIDDVTGEPLVQRDDDHEQTVRNRLAVYRKQTMPLIQYYQQWAQQEPELAPRYCEIDGNQSVEVVRSDITSTLDGMAVEQR